MRRPVSMRPVHYGIATGCVALAMSSTTWWAATSSASPVWVATLILAYSAVELVPLRLPQGGRLSISVGVAVVSLTTLPLIPGLLTQCAGQLVSYALDDDGWRGFALLQDVARRALAFTVSFGAYALLQPFVVNEVWQSVVALGMAGASYTVIDLVAYIAKGHWARGTSILRALISLAGLVGWAYLSQLSVGLVFVLVVDGLGFLAAPVLLLLGLLLQSSFALLLRVRSAYVSTVGALARLAEQQSPETAGHAERVAELCVSAGRHLHMSQEALEGLSFAATLHDIGYLKIEISGAERRTNHGLDPRAAEAGASVIESVDFLAPAARVLRAHAVLMSGSRKALDPRDGLPAAVLYVACAIDHLGRVEVGEMSLVDLEELKCLDVISTYPEVLSAFAAILPSMEATA